MGAFGVIRGSIFVLGALLVLVGFAVMAAAPTDLALAGLWAVLTGGFLIVVTVLERHRYRSEAAEHANEPSGPGGGETPGALESRFRRTGETFYDPTTGRQMRVLVDPSTGERRYVAEG